jgi:hypothetical protein
VLRARCEVASNWRVSGVAHSQRDGSERQRYRCRMTLRYAALILVCLSGVTLAGCDAGIYAPAPASDGSVVVVNKFTGTVQKVVGEHTIDVTPRPPAAAPKSHSLVLLPEPIPLQPVIVHGETEMRGENLLVRVSIVPSKSSLSDSEWADWRSHMLRARPTAGLTLQFWDLSGFVLLEKSIQLSTMQGGVNLKGEYESWYTQISIPVTQDTFGALDGWSVGWNGWPAYTGTIGKEPAK